MSASARSLPVALFVGLRPRQWLKNVLVFAAPLAAGSLLQPDVLLPALAAFVVFCMVSSATYLVNDARDVEADRAHPVKQHRPIAAGHLPVVIALSAAVVLVVVGLGIAWLVTPGLAAVVALYVVFTLSYSFGLKHEPVIELALLSMGFLLRAVAGGVAAGLPISQWFLIVAAFGSLFMAAGKRFSELDRALNATDNPAMRRSLSGYTLGYLRFVWGTAAAVTITGYCLWAFEIGDQPGSLHFTTYSVFPFVLAILRYAVDIDRGKAEAPEDAVLGDRVLWVLGVAWVALFALGTIGG